MSELTIVPGSHAGPIRLGASRADVRREAAAIGMGLSGESGELDYFGDDNAIQVEYIDGTASFIGVSSSPSLARWTIFDVDPFDLPADELVALLAERDGRAPQKASEPLFRKLIVTLYDADEQYDWIARRADREPRFAVWGQIGIGDARYLAAVDAIR